MAIYQLKTFADIVAAIREEMKIPSTDTTTIQRIKRDVNMVYLNEVVPMEKWFWLRDNRDLTTIPKITSGTVTVTSGSAGVTLTVAPAYSVKGYWISIEGQSERYKIASHVAGSTTLVLESVFTGSTNSGLSYILWTDRLALPVDCREVFEVTSDLSSIPLEGCGLQKFRKYVNPIPKAEGFPQYYSVSDFVDPDEFESVSGLPAASTRSSVGYVKTLTFASSVASLFSVGDKIRVSGATDSSYNVESYITSVSSASITYTSVIATDDSSTSDTSYTVTKQGIEADLQRFREILLYPAIYSSRVVLHVDYTKDALPLEDDDDEPLMPIEDRIVLLYGALAKGWPRERNPEEGARNQALFDRKLAKMAGKLDDSTDTPILRPSRVYLSTKRANRGVAPTPYSGYGFGGGSGASVTTGTANTVAIFGSDGSLQSSSVVDTEELGWLDGAESSVTTTLADNQASATTIDTFSSTASGVFVDYVISRGTGNRRAGTLIIATDSSSIAYSDSGTTLGTAGVTLSAVLSAGQIALQYTSTSTGTAPSIKYRARKI